jgi:hypothetical protein
MDPEMADLRTHPPGYLLEGLLSGSWELAGVNFQSRLVSIAFLVLEIGG